MRKTLGHQFLEMFPEYVPRHLGSSPCNSESTLNCAAGCRNSDESIEYVVQNELASSIKPADKPRRLVDISREPIACPQSDCKNKVIGYSSILSHFLFEHPDIQHIEAFCDSFTTLEMSHSSLGYTQSTITALLLYGGKDENHLPGRVGLSIPNGFLMNRNIRFENHFPIFVMVSKTHYSALYGGNHFLQEKDCPHQPKEEILVLWLTSPEILQPLTATITFLNAEHTCSKSQVLKIRDIREPQRPEEFLDKDCDFMWLKSYDIKLFAHGRHGVIAVEIVIHEPEVPRK